MKLIIFITIFSILFWTYAPQYAGANEEYKTFCKKLLQFVSENPGGLSVGCCDYDHPSNDILKEDYNGEPMLTKEECHG